MTMMLGDRREAYIHAFPQFPASWPVLTTEQGHDVLYATWVLGNDYRNRTPLYGAYPPGYLPRVRAMFPDAREVLHAFSGSLPAGQYHRLDLVPRFEGSAAGFYQGSVYDARQSLPLFSDDGYDLVLSDPPYSKADATRYRTASVDRPRALAALADVTAAGGHHVWLDCCWPMHRKAQWRTVGRITIVRSTNHRVRLATIFERQP